MTPRILDLSQPVSDLLRESTKVAHQAVETSDGAKQLLGGNLHKDDYVFFLMMLWQVYDTLEQSLERHASHPTLEPIYNPSLLARAPALADDIAFLMQDSSWKSSPLYKTLISSPPEPLTEYVSRIKEVSRLEDPSQLMAHAYVRYLGDMSGGQTIRHTIAKAYNLDEADGSGLTFYAFKELEGTRIANQGEIRRIKDWFRAGMNAGTNDKAEVKDAIVREANLVFLLNGGLFECITTDGDDNTHVVGPSEKSVVESEGYFNVNSVVTFIFAVGLAHFILVVGGFTGPKGFQKLEVVESWLNNLLQSPPE